MHRSNGTFLFTVTIVSIYLFWLFSKVPNQQTAPLDNAVKQSICNNFTVWNDCLTNYLTPYEGKPNELWSNLRESIAICEQIDEIKSLPIREFNNSDESKRHILPKLNFPSVIITLGIGHDTGAEKKLIKELPSGSEFFGADPMREVNEDLYTRLPGKYFPFAVGSGAGLLNASVLINGTYTRKSVFNVEIVYFLENFVKKTLIDDIWIDAEGAEYSLFEYFYRGGEFDKNKIIFCQFNIEIHRPEVTRKKLIHDFILRLLKDKRYAILRPVQGWHMRLYMLNFENEECVKKYIV